MKRLPKKTEAFEGKPSNRDRRAQKQKKDREEAQKETGAEAERKTGSRKVRVRDSNVGVGKQSQKATRNGKATSMRECVKAEIEKKENIKRTICKREASWSTQRTYRDTGAKPGNKDERRRNTEGTGK